MLKFFRNIFSGAEFKQAPSSYAFNFSQVRAKLAQSSK